VDPHIIINLIFCKDVYLFDLTTPQMVEDVRVIWYGALERCTLLQVWGGAKKRQKKERGRKIMVGGRGVSKESRTD
jgi:hypothetical protein